MHHDYSLSAHINRPTLLRLYGCVSKEHGRGDHNEGDLDEKGDFRKVRMSANSRFEKS